MDYAVEQNQLGLGGCSRKGGSSEKANEVATR